MADEMNTDERAKFIHWHMDYLHTDEMLAAHIWDNQHSAAKAWQARAALSPNTEDMATASAQGFRDGVASLGAAEPSIPALQPVALDPRRIRKFLQALQAGEMSVSRAVEILDAWVGGYYEDDMVPPPPSDSCLIADDEFPMEIVRKLRAELEAKATTLTQGAAIAAGAVPDDFHSHKTAWRGALVAMKGMALADDPDRSYWEHELRAFDRAYAELESASHGQAPAQPLTVAQIEEAIGLRSKAWDTLGAEKIVEAVLQMVNRQAPAHPDAPLPLLVRDIAAELGIKAPEACKSLFAAGCGETSVNMAVTPRMARALRAMHPTPSPQAAQQAPAGETGDQSKGGV